MDLATPVIMGILLGGLYTLIALGLSMVFGVMKLLNVAHGDLVIFASYFAYALITYLGIDPVLSLVIGIPVLFGIGFLIQKFLMARAFRLSIGRSTDHSNRDLTCLRKHISDRFFTYVQRFIELLLHGSFYTG